MLPLTYPRLWLAAGIVLVLIVVSGSLAPGEYVEAISMWNDKLEHASSYAFLTLWFTGIVPRTRYLRVVLGLFALGVLIEILQGAMSFGRDRDFNDVIANSTGIALGFVLAWFWCGGWAQWVETRFRQLRRQ